MHTTTSCAGLQDGTGQAVSTHWTFCPWCGSCIVPLQLMISDPRHFETSECISRRNPRLILGIGRVA
eukprot:248756-Prymnesium_polylepis.1